jgi:hypothetical protein
MNSLLYSRSWNQITLQSCTIPVQFIFTIDHAEPLNRKCRAAKLEFYEKAFRVEVIECIGRYGRTNLGARHGRLKRQQRSRGGSGRLHHGKWRELHRDIGLCGLIRMNGRSSCGIRWNYSALRSR